jgi:hypothetical protein
MEIIKAVSSGAGVGMIGRIFNKYPFDTFTSPFDEIVIETLVERWHAFVMQHPTANFRFDQPTMPMTAAEEVMLNSLVNKFIAICCSELLDEEGKLAQPIIDHYCPELATLLADETRMENTNSTVGQETLRQMLLSYFHELLWHPVSKKWLTENNYKAEFIVKKISFEDYIDLYESVLIEDGGSKAIHNALNEIYHLIMKEPKPEGATVTEKFMQIIQDPLHSYLKPTKNRLEVFDEAFSSKWSEIKANIKKNKDIATLQQRMIKEVVAVYTAQAEVKGFEQFQKYEGEFVTTITRTMSEKAKKDFSERMAKLMGAISNTFSKLLKKSGALEATMNDYKLYGHPLKTHFGEKPKGNQLFGKTSLIQLTAYFNALMSGNASAHAFDIFKTKVLFFAFSRLYTEEGKLKPAVIEGCANPLSPNVALEMTTEYVSRLVNTLFVNWMKNENNQLAYLQSLPDSHIDGIFQHIAADLKQGLTEEFLQQVKGFPFVTHPRVPESRFVISINLEKLPPYRQLQKKLLAIKVMMASIEAECKNEPRMLANVEDLKLATGSLINQYNSRKEIFDCMESNADIADLFSTTLSNMDMAATHIRAQFRELHQLHKDLSNNSETAHFNKDTFQEKIDCALGLVTQEIVNAQHDLQQVKDAVSPLVASKDNSRALHQEIITALKAIVNHAGWAKRVSHGGTLFNHHKVPAKIANLGSFLNADLVLDGDKYLFELNNRFSEKAADQASNPGFFTTRRHHDTSEFYGIVEQLQQMCDTNLYDTVELTSVRDKLQAFQTKLQSENKSARRASIGHH